MATTALPPVTEFDYLSAVQVNARRDFALRFDVNDANPMNTATVVMETPVGLLECTVRRNATVTKKGDSYIWSALFKLDGEPAYLSDLNRMGLRLVTEHTDPVEEWIMRCTRINASPVSTPINTSALYKDFLGWAKQNKLRQSLIPPVNTFSQRLKMYGVEVRRRSSGSVAPYLELMPVDKVTVLYAEEGAGWDA